MNVLSLFDGMACGRLALEKAGINVDNYFASEIDKYAITIAKKNWPDIIHVGDVQNVKGADLPKIDLLIGGSPCQGFSFAGKQLNFDDPRSKLFFDFVRLKDECKPKYFLLENVKMKKESQQIITEYMGVDPVEINSALVSAQNRRRLYWSNLPIEQPEDKGIMLADILQYDEIGIIKSYGKLELRNEKAICLDANYHKGLDNHGQHTGVCKLAGYADLKGHDYVRRVYDPSRKAPTLNAHSGGNLEPKTTTDYKTWRKLTPLECERLQTVPDNYTSGVSNTQRYKMLGNGWTVDVIAHIFKKIIDTPHKTA